MHKGSCLCGAVRFEVTQALKPPDACHCTLCRKSSGHYWVSTDLPRSAVTIHGEDKVTWYHSSEKVRRGFCSVCGASLFWDPVHRDFIAIAMGAFDTPTGTHVEKHIFVADKGDYYELVDGLPQNPR
ncbi:GFA family protein [Myxococcus sp. K15C18031901]|uniref:GFA family protein n=1 Tax=Myxococcus dinghuensis TaxID=2906761 RepID=UPI0020A80EBD|nr:GFA family protein [Myxococcus dinghuensis]MCP3098532.1 GFA family protein [Myxococcus dinghuensis]